MKRVYLIAVALLLATAMTSLWAGPTAEQGPQAAAATGGKPVRGGTLVYADQNDCQTFDPHRSTGGSMAYTLVYDTLVRWSVQPDGKMAAEPRLASEWKLEGSTAIFKLRQGVKFHDGSDWNAEAAKFNLERMNDGKSAGPRLCLRDQVDRHRRCLHDPAQPQRAPRLAPEQPVRSRRRQALHHLQGHGREGGRQVRHHSGAHRRDRAA